MNDFQTLTTLIKFINGESGGGDTPVNPVAPITQTGDFWPGFIAILLCSVIVVAGLFIIKKIIKRSTTNLRHGSNGSVSLNGSMGHITTLERWKIILVAVICALSILLCSTVAVKSFATTNVKVPDQITATVYPSTGQIEVERGYLENLSSYDVKVDAADSKTTTSTEDVANIGTMHITSKPVTAETGHYLYDGNVGDKKAPTFTDSFKKDKTTIIYTIDKGQVDLNSIIDKTIETNLYFSVPYTSITYEVSSEEGGSLSGDTTFTSVEWGTKYEINNNVLIIHADDGDKTITATEKSPYNFDGWSVDPTPTREGYIEGEMISFKANFKAPTECIVQFSSDHADRGEIVDGEDKPATTISVPFGSKFNIDEDGVLWIGEGDSRVFYGVASHGNVLDGWTRDGKQEMTGTITQTTNFQALFALNKYQMSFSAENGEVDPDEPLNDIPHNTPYTINQNTITFYLETGEVFTRTAKPKAGEENKYEFDYWTRNGSKVGDGDKFVYDDFDFIAVFKEKSSILSFHSLHTSDGQVSRWNIDCASPTTTKFRITGEGQIQFSWSGSADVVCVDAIPYEGHHFNNWTAKTDDGESLDVGPYYDLGDLRDFYVHFANDKYDVSFTSQNLSYGHVEYQIGEAEWQKGDFTIENVENGTVYERHENAIIIESEGTKYTIKAEPESGYKFANWSKSPLGNKITSPTVFTAMFIAESKDTTECSFEPDDENHGSVEANDNPMTVAIGSKYKITIDDGITYIAIDNEYVAYAEPVEGFVFDHWEANGKKVTKLEKTIGEEPIDFIAVFAPKVSTLTLTSGANGNVFPTFISSINYNSYCEVQPNSGDLYIDGQKRAWGTPNEGYVFDQWVNNQGEKFTQGFITEDTNLQITFKPKTFDLYFEAVGSAGGVSDNDLKGIPYGTQYQVISATQDSHLPGSIHFTNSLTSLDTWLDVNYEIDKNILFDCWKVNDRKTTSGTITTNMDFFAYFKAPSFDVQIQVTPADSGTVSETFLLDVEYNSYFLASGNQLVINGTKTIIATPNVGYKFTKWTYNGEEVKFERNYIQDHTPFVAVFEQIPAVMHELQIATTSTSKGEINNKTLAANQPSIKLQVEENTKYSIKGDTVYIGSDRSKIYKAVPTNDTAYCFEGWEGFDDAYEGVVTENTEFKANFTEKEFELTFKGENYMDVYDGAAGSPRSEFSITVKAGTLYRTTKDKLSNLDFIDSLLTTINGADRTSEIDIINPDQTTSHRIFAGVKQDYSGIVHFNGWQVTPNFASNQNINCNLTFTPIIERDSFNMYFELPEDYSSAIDIVFSDDDQRDDKESPHLVPYGSRVYQNENTIYVIDDLYGEELFSATIIFNENYHDPIREQEIDASLKYNLDHWDNFGLDEDTVISQTYIWPVLELNNYKIKFVSQNQFGKVWTNDGIIEKYLPYGTMFDWSAYGGGSDITVYNNSADKWAASTIAEPGYDFRGWEATAYYSDYVSVDFNSDTNIIFTNITFTAQFGVGRKYINFGAFSNSGIYQSEKLSSSNERQVGGSFYTAGTDVVELTEQIGGDWERLYANRIELYYWGSEDPPSFTAEVKIDEITKTPYYHFSITAKWNETDETNTARNFRARIIDQTIGGQKNLLKYEHKGWIDQSQINLETKSKVEGEIVDNQVFGIYIPLKVYTIKINQDMSGLVDPGEMQKSQAMFDRQHYGYESYYESEIQDEVVISYSGTLLVKVYNSEYNKYEDPTLFANAYLYDSATQNVYDAFYDSGYLDKSGFNAKLGWYVEFSNKDTILYEEKGYGDENPELTWHDRTVYGTDINLTLVYSEKEATITYSSYDENFGESFGGLALGNDKTSTEVAEEVVEKIGRFNGGSGDNLKGAIAVGDITEDCVWVDEDGKVVKSLATATSLEDLRYFNAKDDHPAGVKKWESCTYYFRYVPALALFDGKDTLTLTCKYGAEQGYDSINIFPVKSTYSSNVQGGGLVPERRLSNYSSTNGEKRPAHRESTYPSWMYEDGVWKIHPTKIVIDESFKNFKSLYGTAYWFYTGREASTGFKLESIENLENIYTDNIIDMSYMFSSYYYGGGGGQIIIGPVIPRNSNAHNNVDEGVPFSGMQSGSGHVVKPTIINNPYLKGTLDLSMWKTSKVIAVESMFEGQNMLNEVILPHQKSFWEVCTIYDAMFAGCDLQDLTVPKEIETEAGTKEENYFGVSAKSMASMYAGNENLITLNIEHDKFGENAENTYAMFDGCGSLREVNIPNNALFASKAINTGRMFANCSSLTSLDFSGNLKFASSSTNASEMYSGCSSLSKFNIVYFFSNVSHYDINIDNMFYDCNNVSEFTIGPAWWDKDLYMGNALRINYNGEWNCPSSHESQSLYWIPDHPGTQTWVRTMPKAIYDIENKTLTFRSDNNQYNEPSVKVYYFHALTDDWSGYTYGYTVNDGYFTGYDNFDPATSLPPWYTIKTDPVTKQSKIVLDAPAQNVIFESSFRDVYVTNLSCWFMSDSDGKGFGNFWSEDEMGVRSKGFSSLNCEGVESFASMFGGFSNELAADSSSWSSRVYSDSINNEVLRDDDSESMRIEDTYNTTLKSIDVSTLNLDYQDISGLFANCVSLTDITFPDETFCPLCLDGLFYNCKSLYSLDNIKNFDKMDLYTSPTLNLMFCDCENLTKIDLKGFDFRNYYSEDDSYVLGMFSGCNKLSELKFYPYYDDENHQGGWQFNLYTAGLPGSSNTSQNPWFWVEASDFVQKQQGVGDPFYLRHLEDYYDWTDEYYYNSSLPWPACNVYMREQLSCTIKRDSSQITEHIASVECATSEGYIEPIGSTSYTFVDQTSYRVDNNELIIGHQSFKAVSNPEYDFGFWTLNGERVTSGQSGTLTQDVVFYASMKENSLTPKAVYRYGENDKSLTFYYDKQDYSQEENTVVFPISKDDICPPWLKQTQRSYSRNTSYNWPYLESLVPLAETVRFDTSFKNYDTLESLQLWFAADSNGVQPYKKFESLVDGEWVEGFTNLNTFSVENVKGLFGGVFNIEYTYGTGADSVYASPYDTFGHSFKSLDLSTLDLKPVSDWSYLFANCLKLEKVTFQEDIDEARPQSLSSLFANCESFKAAKEGEAVDVKDCIVNLDKLNTSKCQDFSFMFYGCSSLEILNLSNFSTPFYYEQPKVHLPHMLDAQFGGEKRPISHRTQSDAYIFYDTVRLKDITWNINIADVEWYKYNMSVQDGSKSWMLNFYDSGLGNFDTSTKWKLEYNDYPHTDDAAPKIGNLYESYFFPTYSSQIYQQIFPEERYNRVNYYVSGRITRDSSTEKTVKFTVNDESLGSINNKEADAVSYSFVNSAQVLIDTVEPSVLYADNSAYLAIPKEGGQFKYWIINSGPQQGKVVDLNYAQTFLAKDVDDNGVEFQAVFEKAEKTAKAVFTAAETPTDASTLTFVYDDKKYDQNDVKVKVYDVKVNTTDTNFPAWYKEAGDSWHANDFRKIPQFDDFIINGTPNGIKINFDASFKDFDYLRSMSCWFMPTVRKINNVETIYNPFIFEKEYFKGLENINTSNLTNLKYMFGGHEYFNDYTGNNIASGRIDLTGFNSRLIGDEKPLTNIDGLFANCINLSTVIFGDAFNWSNISSASYLFYNCQTLINDPTSLAGALARINTSNLTDISYMLSIYHNSYNTTKEIYDTRTISFPSNFKTDNVTNFEGLFSGHDDVKNLIISSDESSFSTRNALSMKSLFEKNTIMEHFSFEDAWNFDTKYVPDMSYMFSNCLALTDTSDVVKYINTKSCENMSYMFSECSGLVSFDIKREDEAVDITDTSYMFNNCVNLKKVNLTHFYLKDIFQPVSAFVSARVLPCVNMFAISDSQDGFNDIVEHIIISDPIRWNYDITFYDMGISNYDYWNCSRYDNWTDVDPYYSPKADSLPRNEITDDPFSYGNFVRARAAKNYIIQSETEQWGSVIDYENALDSYKSLCMVTDELDSSYIDYSFGRAYVESEGSPILIIETNLDDLGNPRNTYKFEARTNDQNTWFGGWYFSDYYGTYEVPTANDDPIYLSLDDNIDSFMPAFKGAAPSVVWSKVYLEKEERYETTLVFTDKAIDASQYYEVMTLDRVLEYRSDDEQGHFPWYGDSSITKVSFSETFDKVNFGTWNLNGLFAGLSNVQTLDLSKLNISQVEDLQNLFNGCTSLTSIHMPEKTSNDIQYNLLNAFYGCTNLNYVNFGSISQAYAVDWGTKVTSCLEKCTNFKEFTISKNWDTYTEELLDGTNPTSGWCNENGDFFDSNLIRGLNFAGTYTKAGKIVTVTEPKKYSGEVRVSGNTNIWIEDNASVSVTAQSVDGKLVIKADGVYHKTYDDFNVHYGTGFAMDGWLYYRYDKTTGSVIEERITDTPTQITFDPENTARIEPSINTNACPYVIYTADSSTGDISLTVKYGDPTELTDRWVPFITDWHKDPAEVSVLVNSYRESELSPFYQMIQNLRNKYNVYIDYGKLRKIIFDDSMKSFEDVISCQYMFAYLPYPAVGSEGFNADGIQGLENLVTKNATDMSYMFYACPVMSINSSNLDLTSATDASYMFGSFSFYDDYEGEWIYNDCKIEDISFAEGKSSSNLIDATGMFSAACARSIDMEYLDFSKTTSMSKMFQGAGSLRREIDPYNYEPLVISAPSVFDTSSVIDMSWMFNECKMNNQLSEFPISQFNTKEVKYMNNMFDGLSEKEGTVWYDYTPHFAQDFLNAPNLDTSKVVDMSYMFSGMYLHDCDFSKINTASCTNLSYMFASVILQYDSVEDQAVDLSSFNTEKVTNFEGMFYSFRFEGDGEFRSELDITGFDIKSAQSMSSMFRSSEFKTISVDEDIWNIKQGVDTEGMLDGCSDLVGQEGTTIEQLKNSVDIWRNDKTYAKIDKPVNDRDYDKYHKEYGLFSTHKSPKVVFLNEGSKLESNEQVGTLGKSSSSITMILTNGARSWKNYDAEVYEINDNWDFASNKAPWFNTDGTLKGYAEDAGSVRIEASFKDTLYLDTDKTKELTSLSGWFANMKYLRYVDNFSCLPKQIEDIDHLFYNCERLENINYYDPRIVPETSTYFTNFMEGDSYPIKDYSFAFAGCSWLDIINPGLLGSKEATTFESAFEGSGLSSIDLRGIKTSNVTNMKSMFNNCSYLERIYVSDDAEDDAEWDVTKVTQFENIFGGCTNLVGGDDTHATTWTEEMASKIEYAHIDKAGAPGLLTLGVAYPKAVTLKDNDKIKLKFYYDTKSHVYDDGRLTDYPVYKDYGSSAYNGWQINENLKNTVTSVEFDTSLHDFTSAYPYGLYAERDIVFYAMSGWFDGYQELVEVTGTKNINTDNMLGFEFPRTFANCKNLKEVDFDDDFAVGHTLNLDRTFYNCTSLEKVDLGGATNIGQWMDGTFVNCGKLTTITVSPDFTGWNTYEQTRAIFTGCNSLVGGNGTSFVTEYANLKEVAEFRNYAHIDQGKSDPGYFTARVKQSERSLNEGHNINEVANVYGKVMFDNIADDGAAQVSPLPVEVTFNYAINGDNQTAKTITDEEGNFCFESIPVGSVGTIEFNANGYSGKTENVSVPSEGLTNINILAEHIAESIKSAIKDLATKLSLRRLEHIQQ